MTNKPKHNGPHPVEIDYKTLDSLCAIHCTGEEIAAILEIDYDTLNRRLSTEGHGGFAEYFKRKSAKGKASLRKRQFSSAIDGNVPMMIWMGKQLLGQSDGNDRGNSDEEAKPLKVVFEVAEAVKDIRITEGE